MFHLQSFLEGQMQVELSSAFPQRLLNLCAQEHIPFWSVQWHSPQNISFTIYQKHFPRLRQLSQQIKGELEGQSSRGLPSLWKRVRRRSGFLLGLCLSLLTVTVLSRFILVIDISGNHNTSTAQIRYALEQAGLHIGAYSPHLQNSQLQQQVLTQLEGVSWISINFYGTRAEVTLQEAVPPPEIYPTQGLYDVISTAAGIIEEIRVHKGDAMVAVGDTVTQGDLLISGMVELEPPLYSTEPSRWLFVPSSGHITARTWHSLTAVIPLTAQVKEPYGVTQHSYQWYLLGETFTFFQNTLLFLPNYDKIKEASHFPSLETLPLAFHCIQETPYHLVETSLSQEACQALLQSSLLQTLQTQIGDTGEVLSTDFVSQEKNGLLQVTLTAECRQSIGETVEGSLPSPSPEEVP